MNTRGGHLAAAALLLAGCTQLTEVVVVVDSDLAVPEELDGVRIDVTSPGGEFRRATAALAGERALPLPRTLGIVHRGGPLEPLVVVATGTLGGRDVVQRRARLAFAPGRTVELRLDLLRSCVGVACPVDQTCAENGCAPSDVDVALLRDWRGSAERLDATAPLPDAGDGGAGDACAPLAEACNERDDDCDGRTDEDFDLLTDPARCGSCDRACPEAANASPICAGGTCGLACDPGWGDCDGSDATGCEALLLRPSTCGACGVACSGATPFCSGEPGGAIGCTATCDAPMTPCSGSCVDVSRSAAHCGACDNACAAVSGAVPTCADAVCGFRCLTDLFDCNGIAADGCESTLRTLTTCGSCSTSCLLANATESCATGTCVLVACEPGFRDCNTVVADGCETRTDSDLANCGECGGACPASAPQAAVGCAAGVCALSCDPGWADCNRVASDGCEASLSSTLTCGSCGIRCDGATPLCASDATGTPACVAACAPGEELCASTCTSTDGDPRHCGTCENACPSAPSSSPTCMGGVCAIACDPGSGDCDGSRSNGCERSLTTTSDCGACGTACAPGRVCASGACRCPAGLVESAGACLDLTRDPLNCGAVGTACGDREYCVSSACACRPGLTRAGDGTCVDTDTDPNHCGMLGRRCTFSSPNCSAGACAGGCPASTTRCGSFSGAACADLRSDPLHCGGCDTVCAVDEVCVASRCEPFRTGAGCTSCPCESQCPVFGFASCCTYPMTPDVVCVDAASCP